MDAVNRAFPFDRYLGHRAEQQSATTATVNGLCLHQLFEEQARRTPDFVALVFEEHRLSYSELNRRADQLACYLRGRGIAPDTRVGLFMERSAAMIVGILGILKAGGAYVPIDPAYPQARIAFMLENADAKLLLTQSVLLSRFAFGAPEAVCMDSSDWSIRGESSIGMAPGPENLAYVIYTSGSTGRPKGVCIEHRNIINYALGVAARLRFQPGRSYALVSSIAADLGNTVIFPALITGGCLHVISQERAEDQALLSEYFDRE
jgi:non-ribosomal peptide synthetase component F